VTDLTIAPASAETFAVAIEWAAAEGWNPGLDDLAAFHAADPPGFLIGTRDGEPVSSISVVRYGPDFGFLGFYIVRSDQRGTGAGIATWNAGMARLGERCIGLDGVVAQQDNYRRSGFALAGRNLRHGGVPALERAPAPGSVRAAEAADLPAILAYDRRFFAARRDRFAATWALPAEGARRAARLALRDGGIAGYGVIRACRSGHKIGPLFAEDEATAEALFAALAGAVPERSEVFLDTPADNAAALRLAARHGLAPVFETARMYRGPAPDLPLAQTFGITTFELG